MFVCLRLTMWKEEQASAEPWLLEWCYASSGWSSSSAHALCFAMGAVLHPVLEAWAVDAIAPWIAWLASLFGVLLRSVARGVASSSACGGTAFVAGDGFVSGRALVGRGMQGERSGQWKAARTCPDLAPAGT